MWDKGVILPVAGMRKQSREKMVFLRGAVAIDRYLGGEDLTSIRKELAISISRWQRWWQSFKEVVRSKDQPLPQIQERLRQPLELIEAWLKVWEKHKEKSDLALRLDLDTNPTPPAFKTSQQT
ncbi:MAG: hypothetical protein H5U00_12280, partial [Clostridia bacterium]|nr:hypothetical protein [Clostridia bacterium]